MEKLRKFAGALITGVLSLAIAACVCAYEYQEKISMDGGIWYMLSDGFFVSSVLVLGGSLLAVISGMGGFDGIAYIFYSIRSRFFANREVWEARKEYAGFKKERQEKYKSHKSGVAVGLVCLALAVLFDVIYQTV